MSKFALVPRIATLANTQNDRRVDKYLRHSNEHEAKIISTDIN